jgi:signal transduction histidine kinase/AmiR/NasT family two-component response regulator
VLGAALTGALLSGAPLSVAGTVSAIALPPAAWLAAKRLGWTDRSAMVMVGAFAASVALAAWQIGPAADLHWLFISNVVMIFLALEERHPNPQAAAIGINAGAFASFTTLQATGMWTGAVPLAGQLGISWAVRAVALFNLLWIMRYFRNNERRFRRVLRFARDEGWRAAADREAFFADMCHEIRTPLVALTHVHDVLLKSPRDAEERALVEQAIAAGDHLVAVLNDALDLARMDAGRLELDRRPFSLPELVQETVSLWRPIAGARKVDVEADVELTDRTVRLGDRRRLKQVLYNLMSNAVKFTERGKVTLRVRASEGTRVEFRVIDQGIGMTPEQLERVFEAFAQADSSTGSRYGGTGLGLAISQRLVHVFGGKLDVTSAPGVGSEFQFEVPLAVAALEDIEQPVVGDEARATPLRVLLAEDTVVNQWVIRRMLEDLGHTVEVAADGRSAVEAWRNDRPDVILMDVQMPEMDGLTATRRIRAQEEVGKAEVPILALTAHAMPAEVEQCLRAGMTGHLSKPVRQRDLQRALLDAVQVAKRTIKPKDHIDVAPQSR